jgi:hypothetical protein
MRLRFRMTWFAVVVIASAAQTRIAAAADCDLKALVQQCCSAKNCEGKVLNNRGSHNCKGSNGKSWHPSAKQREPGGPITPALCSNL